MIVSLSNPSKAHAGSILNIWQENCILQRIVHIFWKDDSLEKEKPIGRSELRPPLIDRQIGSIL